jgi:hypothetical protein
MGEERRSVHDLTGEESPAGGRDPSDRAVAWQGRRTVQHAGAFGLYMAVSLLLFGPKILPHMSTRILSSATTEASVFVWSLSWWPHALGHGLNPLFTHLAWAPTGLNLAWSATAPIPCLILAPLTLAFGPVVSFNVATLLTPAVTAWTAYLLCRRLVRSFWPAVAGGAVFGFSPGLLVEMKAGHLNLSMLFVLPLCAYLVVRRLEGTMSPRRFVVLLACALVAQFGIFIEIFATMTLVGGIVGLALVLLSPPERRADLIRTGGLIALAYGLALLAVSPYLFAMIAGPQALKPAGFRGIALGLQRTKDLWLFVVPGHNTWIGTSLLGRAPQASKNPWYLGLPLLAILVHLWITGRRRLLVRVLGIGFLVSAVLALGPHLPAAGHRIPLPWRAVQALPLFGRARAGRLMSFGFLFAGVSLAVWLAEARRSVIRWGVAAAAVVLLAPNLAVPWTAEVAPPAFFTSGQYRQYLSPGEILMVVDGSKGTEMYWQVATSFSVGIAGWYWGFLPPSYPHRAAGQRLELGHVRPQDGPVLRAFVSANHVGAVVFGRVPARAVSLMSAMLGVVPVRVGGITLLRLPG